MKLPVHRWFRYSAGFSAEWAEQLIRERNPSTVLDPFAGSGTTLLAAESVGSLAYGYESHPFVARIAAAKTHWNQADGRLLGAAEELLRIARQHTLPKLDNVPNLLGKCYTPDVLQKLYSLRDAYTCCTDLFDHAISELLWLAITSILRSCSFVGTAQWQYVLPNKRKIKTADPFQAFGQKIADFAADMIVLRDSGCRSDSKVLLHDARAAPDAIPRESIDLVVTSPPYPNNYDYADATRLEMTFWGEIQGWGDLQEVVRQFIIRSCSQHATAEKLNLQILLRTPVVDSIRDELSAVCNELATIRQTKGGKKAYHTMIAAYFCDLSKVFQALRTVCKAGCTLCFVIGDSAPYGVYAPVELWLGKLALAAGFKSYSFEKLRDRNIKWMNRKHRVPLKEGRLWIRG
ncbi:MAG: DNA modification methylase [Verrucomicrobia bacterium]|nr:MAG: DNA modification methylase [Verrucomicrobiota bacterium]